MENVTMVQVDAVRLAKLEEMERKQKLSARKAAAKIQLYAEKAKAAGIVVTKAEVDAKIAEEDARRASESVPSVTTVPAYEEE
jgi:hypothetical protein